ncbi:unnamed protein product [Brassica oleracea var. botrytis]
MLLHRQNSILVEPFVDTKAPKDLRKETLWSSSKRAYKKR